MTPALIPLGEGTAEFIEKRSRFIGHIWQVETEEAALEKIRVTREKYWDARHNVFAYVAGSGARYSDDGEPSGSGGLPVMNVLTNTGVGSVCCVVTRYFGGILLGFGGLQRAYSKAASLALDNAGIGQLAELSCLAVSCSYAMYERVNRFFTGGGAVVENTDFGVDVALDAWLPADELDSTAEQLKNLTGGAAKIIKKEGLRTIIISL